jgi:hypothetical protein
MSYKVKAGGARSFISIIKDESLIPEGTVLELEGTGGVRKVISPSQFAGKFVALDNLLAVTTDPDSELPVTDGVLISSKEIATRPTSGAAWSALVSAANGAASGVANIADQDSKHDVQTLALALYSVRTKEKTAEARSAVVRAIGTEYNSGGAWLEVGRNLGAYVIAADVLGMRASDGTTDGERVERWIKDWLTRNDIPDTNGNPKMFHEQAFSSGSNASAQIGFAYATVGAYLRDSSVLQKAWDLYRRFVGDPTAPDPRGINLSQGIAAGWAHDDEKALAINPKGSTKNGIRIDGAIINDMRRGGDFKHPPGYTQYPWTGTDGLVPAALVLHRAGYPAFEVADRAILRAMEYLYWLRQETGNVEWFSGERGQAQIHIVNWKYGTKFPIKYPVGLNRCIGFLDWTHPI